MGSSSSGSSNSGSAYAGPPAGATAQ
jgi:hypothetical protein